jgi:3-dehydroquinate synthetase
MGEFLVGTGRVVIGRGMLDSDVVLGDAAPATIAVIAPDDLDAIATRVEAALGTRARVARVGVPDGAAAKTLGTVERVALALNDLGVTRGDLIVGVGGGSVTDLAGFVAATYLRGIAVVYVPTTLLAAVDAAIGGKTAVDVGGKNLVGAFRHPDRVVVDLDLLDGLPIDLRRQGMAEALKAGFVADPLLVDLLERDGIDADLDEVVSRAIAVKAAIVERDFTERGDRALLNYGHTIGHAIETVAGMPHGEAVAVGMVAAGRASAIAAGFAHEARQTAAIAGLGLPIDARGLDPDEVERQIGLDKKRDHAGLRMVLLEDIGRPRVDHVDPTTVRAALDAVGIRRPS